MQIDKVQLNKNTKILDLDFNFFVWYTQNCINSLLSAKKLTEEAREKQKLETK